MKPTIAIIGGNGQMGRWFTRFFESQGLEVLVADVDTPQTSQEVAARADVVILSVPIPKVTEVAREVAPFLSPDAALVDLTSVKQRPMAAMMAAFPGEVVGTHPLFGPGEATIAGHDHGALPGAGGTLVPVAPGPPDSGRRPGQDHHAPRNMTASWPWSRAWLISSSSPSGRSSGTWGSPRKIWRSFPPPPLPPCIT